MLPEQFLTTTLRVHPHGESVARILAAAIQAVEPEQAIRRFVQCTGQELVVDGRKYVILSIISGGYWYTKEHLCVFLVG